MGDSKWCPNKLHRATGGHGQAQAGRVKQADCPYCIIANLRAQVRELEAIKLAADEMTDDVGVENIRGKEILVDLAEYNKLVKALNPSGGKE